MTLEPRLRGLKIDDVKVKNRQVAKARDVESSLRLEMLHMQGLIQRNAIFALDNAYEFCFESDLAPFRERSPDNSQHLCCYANLSAYVDRFIDAFLISLAT